MFASTFDSYFVQNCFCFASTLACFVVQRWSLLHRFAFIPHKKIACVCIFRSSFSVQSCLFRIVFLYLHIELIMFALFCTFWNYRFFTEMPTFVSRFPFVCSFACLRFSFFAFSTFLRFRVFAFSEFLRFCVLCET